MKATVDRHQRKIGMAVLALVLVCDPGGFQFAVMVFTPALRTQLFLTGCNHHPQKS
jgi:hypothetical protein